MTKFTIELSPAEWEIMHSVWDANRPVSVRDVIRSIYPNKEKAYSTVQTTMNILVNKRVLTKERDGAYYYYVPTVSKEDARHNSLRGAASRMFNGSYLAMASFLVESLDLEPQEIEKFKQLLSD